MMFILAVASYARSTYASLHFFHYQISLLHSPTTMFNKLFGSASIYYCVIKNTFSSYFVTIPTGSQTMSVDFVLGYLVHNSNMTVIYSNNQNYSIPNTIEIAATTNNKQKMLSKPLLIYR